MMDQFTATSMEVAREKPLEETRVSTDVLKEPREGELILAVERFGLSSNNITYAQLGDRFGLGYWRPFPAEDGWGRVPAWGIARVLAGDPTLAQVGDRFVGLVPMADRMRLRAVRTPAGLRDTSAERSGMLPVYRDMRSVALDQGWREELLDVHLVLRPAYPPAALLDDELGRDGTRVVLLTSATSKTALMTARLLSDAGWTSLGSPQPHTSLPPSARVPTATCIRTTRSLPCPYSRRSCSMWPGILRWLEPYTTAWEET